MRRICCVSKNRSNGKEITERKLKEARMEQKEQEVAMKNGLKKRTQYDEILRPRGETEETRRKYTK